MSYNRKIIPVTVNKESILSVTCDCCNKTIETDKLPDNWCELSTYFSYYGSDNDFEDYEICSLNCLNNKIKEIIEEGDYEHLKFNISYNQVFYPI